VPSKFLGWLTLYQKRPSCIALTLGIVKQHHWSSFRPPPESRAGLRQTDFSDSEGRHLGLGGHLQLAASECVFDRNEFILEVWEEV